MKVAVGLCSLVLAPASALSITITAQTTYDYMDASGFTTKQKTSDVGHGVLPVSVYSLHYASNGATSGTAYWDPLVTRVYSRFDSAPKVTYTDSVGATISAVNVSDIVTLTSNTLTNGTYVDLDFSLAANVFMSASQPHPANVRIGDLYTFISILATPKTLTIFTKRGVRSSTLRLGFRSAERTYWIPR